MSCDSRGLEDEEISQLQVPTLQDECQEAHCSEIRNCQQSGVAEMAPRSHVNSTFVEDAKNHSMGEAL